MAQTQLNFNDLGWRGKLALMVAMAIGLAAATALILFSLGLALLLLPVVAVAFVIGRWRLRKVMDQAARPRPDATRTIDVEYRVIDKDSKPRR